MRSAIQISLWWESTIRSVICWHHLPAGPPTSASQCSNTVMEQGWTLWPSISFPGHLLNDLRILRFAVGRLLLLFLSLPLSFHRDQSLTAFWSSLLTSTPSPLYPSSNESLAHLALPVPEEVHWPWGWPTCWDLKPRAKRGKRNLLHPSNAFRKFTINDSFLWLWGLWPLLTTERATLIKNFFTLFSV